MKTLALPTNPLRKQKANLLSFAFLFLALLQAAALAAVRDVSGREKTPPGADEMVRYLDGHLIDALALFLAFFWIARLGKLGRGVAYLAAFLFFAAAVIQTISVYQTGGYVSRLALENLAHITLFITPATVSMVVAGAATYLLFPLSVEFLASRLPRIPASPLGVSLASVAAVAILSQSSSWLPPPGARRGYRLPDLARRSPARMLATTIDGTFFGQDEEDVRLTASEVTAAEALGFVIDNDAPLPLVKDYYYEDELPFGSPLGTIKKPNVIVFFTEGLSARTINAYGSPYAGLTPNMDAFARQSIRVDNYYNHTASTYRGLLGQVCSFYPWFSGSGFTAHPERGLQGLPKYPCATEVLGRRGYKSHFLFTQKNSVTQLDELMAHIGFDAVWTAKSLTEQFLPEAKALRDDGLTDHQFIEAFIGFLRQEEKTAALRDERQPFFASLYNIETHAWQDTKSDGEPYGDGKNASLNTIHNFDHAFGQFWEYFSHSTLQENTLVIVTSDHAHFHEKGFVEIMGEDYQPLFVDKIPLLIRHPNQESALTYDANLATSIDFAPTLMHLLGIPNETNGFIGTSIFSKRNDARRPSSIASLGGHDLYLITPDGILHGEQAKAAHGGTMKIAEKLINFMRMLEREDRLWNEPADHPQDVALPGRDVGSDTGSIERASGDSTATGQPGRP